MKRFFTIIMAIMTAVVSASAQEASAAVPDNEVSGKAYIYCKVSFEYTKVLKEEKIHNYTRKVKEYARTLTIDCRHENDDLISFMGMVKDNDGNPKLFKSSMAGLNWLGMMGWEMMPYPRAYDPDLIDKSVYWFRLDVTGLTIEQINRKLSELGAAKRM